MVSENYHHSQQVGVKPMALFNLHQIKTTLPKDPKMERGIGQYAIIKLVLGGTYLIQGVNYISMFGNNSFRPT